MLQGMKILHILRPETPQKCGVLYYQNISLSLTFSLPRVKKELQKPRTNNRSIKNGCH
jgi:hypothetical protein